MTFLNDQPFIKSADDINILTTTASISSFNFSTLYTNNSHNTLLKVLRKLIDFCFKADKWDFKTVDKYDVEWIAQDKTFSVTFRKMKLKHSVKFLSSNCFFKYGNKVFKLVTGIHWLWILLYLFQICSSSIIRTSGLIKSNKLEMKGLGSSEILLDSLMTWWCQWLRWVWKKLRQNLSLWSGTKERESWLSRRIISRAHDYFQR